MGKNAIQAKQVQIQSLKSDLEKAKSFLIFEYSGLNAKTLTTLRHELHKSEAKLYVLKNNILARALKEANIEGLEQDMKGPNAIAISFGDEIAPFKNVNDVAQKFEVVKLKSGFIENQVADQAKVKQLAALPNRSGLYSMLLSCLQSPIRSVLYGLKAVSETKPN